MRETNLAQYIVNWFIEDGWEVYKEVCLGKWSHGAPRADIVARRGNLIWVVETKQSMCLALLDQALRIYRYYPAHYVSVGIWSPRSRNYHHYAAHEFLRHIGIGLFYVSELGGGINCSISPSLRRRGISVERWNELLHDEQKATIAGTKNGYYWTPFKSTVSKIQGFLKRHPGSTLHEIIRNIIHHYNCDSTAKRAISQHLRDGVIKGIRIDKTRKPYRYYLEQPCKRRMKS